MRARLVAGSLLIVLAVSVAWAQALGTAFTYQGRLIQSGEPVGDLCDFQFRLFDALSGGSQQGPTLVLDGVGADPPPVGVVDGLFTVALDFGVGVFDGNAKFLDIQVRRPSGVGLYTLLAPRQPITAAPYAVRALIDETFAVPFAQTFSFLGSLFTLNNPDPIGTAIFAQADEGTALIGHTQSGVGLLATAAGPGTAARIVGQGTGVALRVTGNNAGAADFLSTNPTLGPLVTMNNAGTGATLDVRNTNAGGTGVFALAKNQAGFFGNSDNTGNVPVLETTTIGNGVALRGSSNGTNGVADFETFNVNSPAPAVRVLNVTQGPGMSLANAGPAPGIHSEASGLGEAGRFEISLPSNDRDALVGSTLGSGDGVDGFSDEGNGVFGMSNTGLTFAQGPGFIIAGVRGDTGIVNSADNFAVAGVGNGYGTGVLGIGEGGGHGVVGVSGIDESARAVPGVWGMTREDGAGSTAWPPFFPIEGTAGAKGMVGVLGQAFNRVGVWGESIQDIGVVGTAGEAADSGILPSGPVGVFGSVSGSAGVAGWFALRDASNTSPALIAQHDGEGTAALIVANDTNSAAPALHVIHDGVGSAGRFEVNNEDEFANPGIEVLQRGLGNGLRIATETVANPQTSLVVHQQGMGRVAEFRTFHATTVNEAVSVTGRLLGIRSFANAPSGLTRGVLGECISPDGRGVEGHATAATGLTRGVRGVSDSTGGVGVGALASAASGFTFGVNATSVSTQGVGVLGNATATSGATTGVHGESASSSATAKGVRGFSIGGTGVQGETLNPSGFGVFAIGQLGATGPKPFRIDHPDDPENQYLLHYASECPEVVNFYSGKATLDGAGEAVVELPHYFAKINKDPRYSLTAVGAPMPMLHVAAEISEEALAAGEKAGPGETAPPCSFRIAGGAPGGKVSWRVEALRNDLWMRAHGAAVEVEKTEAERGTYQHPGFYGQPSENGMN